MTWWSVGLPMTWWSVGLVVWGLIVAFGVGVLVGAHNVGPEPAETWPADDELLWTGGVQR